jgi:hypothetical protein
MPAYTQAPRGTIGTRQARRQPVWWRLFRAGVRGRLAEAEKIIIVVKKCSRVIIENICFFVFHE